MIGLDGGSQSSFIATSLIKDLELQTIEQQELAVCEFESQASVNLLNLT